MNKKIKAFLAGTIINIVNLIVLTLVIRMINDLSYLLFFVYIMLPLIISYAIIRCFADIKNIKECLLYSVVALVLHIVYAQTAGFVMNVILSYEPGWDLAFGSIFTYVGLIVLIIYFLIRLGIARLKKK